MEEELGMSSRDIKSLELELEQSRLQISAKDKEIRRERQTVEDLRTELRNIKTGLDRSSRYIQEPKELKEAVKELYRKHLDDFKPVSGLKISTLVHIHRDKLHLCKCEIEYGSIEGQNCMQICAINLASGDKMHVAHLCHQLIYNADLYIYTLTL